MFQLLDVLKPGLAGSPDSVLPQADLYVDGQSQPLTADAQELLKKVAAGGVPAYITSNLRRVAEDNGLVVTPSTTPNEIIGALQQMASDSD